MYRCAFYTAMGVTNDGPRPTDRQCIEWFTRLMAQAEHRTDPPVMFVEQPPLIGRSGRAQRVVPEVVIRQWNAQVPLPPWKDLAQ
jgi:hypothetical protein